MLEIRRQRPYSDNSFNAPEITLAKAAEDLFALLGQVQTLHHFTRENLQKKIIKLLNYFKRNITQLNHSDENLLICHYVVCLVFDDVIQNTNWGQKVNWSRYSLIKLYYQNINDDKFFIILSRMTKEAHLFIDILELMYLFLRLGYQGKYRHTKKNLELTYLSAYLFKLIRQFRGHPPKRLSPKLFKPLRPITDEPDEPSKSAGLFIFFATASIIMTIFLSLSYLMEIKTNETYKNITKTQQSVSFSTK